MTAPIVFGNGMTKNVISLHSRLLRCHCLFQIRPLTVKPGQYQKEPRKAGPKVLMNDCDAVGAVDAWMFWIWLPTAPAPSGPHSLAQAEDQTPCR
jgi:hypothetical protein